MKKRIFLAMCCIMAAFVCGCGQAEEPVVETSESVEEVSETFEEVKVVVGYDCAGEDALKYEYDEYGRLAKSITISWTNNQPANYIVYEYDEADRCIGQTFYDKEDAVTGTREIAYDDLGNCVKDITYDASGVEVMKEINEYDANGNLIRCDEIDEYGYEASYEYQYDTDGNLLFDIKYADKAYKNEYLYDENGLLYRMNTYWDDVLFGYYEYEYDANGNCIKETDGSTKFLTVKEMIYDESGNMIEKKFYYESTGWELDSHFKYIYNEGGQVLESENVLTGAKVQYTYNEQGDCLSVCNYAATGESSGSTEYIYDEGGRLTRCNEYNESGELFHYEEYTFDEDGDLLSYYNYDGNGKAEGAFEVYEYGYIQVMEK